MNLPFAGVMISGQISELTGWTKRIGFGKSSRLTFPTPSAASAMQGPGRHGREGGPNLVTAVAEAGSKGPLNPEWVEWLMGLPKGWTA